MSEKPSISVITPVFNGEKYLRECLESVLCQQGVTFEHIVVDDGSDDGTAAIVSDYPHVVYFQQERKGAAAARNKGLSIASGSFVKFLDADDLLVEGALLKQFKATSSGSKKEIAYGYLETFCGDERELKLRPDSPEKTDLLADLIVRNILTSLPLYPVEALRCVGGFDERMHARQEWDLNIRIACKGYMFKYDDIFVYRQRHHGDLSRITNRKLEYQREKRNIDYTFETIGPFKNREILDAWSYQVWNLGRMFMAEGDIDSAKKFFNYAKSFSRDGYKKYFSLKYRLITEILGPVISDRIFYYLRRNKFI